MYPWPYCCWKRTISASITGTTRTKPRNPEGKAAPGDCGPADPVLDHVIQVGRTGAGHQPLVPARGPWWPELGNRSSGLPDTDPVCAWNGNPTRSGEWSGVSSTALRAPQAIRGRWRSLMHSDRAKKLHPALAVHWRLNPPAMTLHGRGTNRPGSSETSQVPGNRYTSGPPRGGIHTPYSLQSST